MELTLYVIDEINAMLEGLSKDDHEEVVQRMKLPIKGAFATAAVQMGIEDGKEKMFTDEGFFSIYQLDQVFSILVELGYDVDDIKIEDMREELSHPVEEHEIPEVDKDYFSDCGVELWDHQLEFFQEFPKHQCGIFDASTSAGKTLIMGGTAKFYDEHYGSLCVTVNDKLAKDAAKMMEVMGLDYVLLDAKKPAKKRRELIKKHRHFITTRKIAINHSDDFEGFVGTFIVDECHILGDAFHHFASKIMADCPIRLGLTGTLPEKSHDPLKRQRIFNMIGGPVIHEVLPSYLMEKGYAAKLDIRMITLVDNPGIRKQMEAGSEWCWQMEEAHYNKDINRIRTIAQFIDENCPRNTLIICRPELGVKLAEMLECDFVDGDTPGSVREGYYKQFDELDNYRLVASIGTSGVGLSIDMIHYGVVIDIGENPSVAGQSVGRFMRKDNKGGKKDSATVWDIFSNTKYGDKHRKGRIRYYKKRGFDFDKSYKKLTVPEG